MLGSCYKIKGEKQILATIGFVRVKGRKKNLGYNGTPLNFEWEEKNGLDYKGKVEWARGEKNNLGYNSFFFNQVLSLYR